MIIDKEERMDIMSNKGSAKKGKASSLICMNILICDDNRHFANRISDYVTLYCEGHELHAECAVYDSAEAVLANKESFQSQIAFLDVDMKPMNGIELGKKLRSVNPEMIIVYISALLEFALEGYTVSAFRYLLKRDLEQMFAVCMDEVLEALSPPGEALSVSSKGETIEIPYKTIGYLESDLRKINVYGTGTNQLICSFYGKLSEVADELKPNRFLRIARSYLVNISQVRSIKNYQVTLKNGKIFNTSRKEYPQIKEQYLEWRGRLK